MTGRDLRTLREACGVTMGDLADAAGWTVVRVSDMERHDDMLHYEEQAYVAHLARIVRARTPVATIDAPKDSAP